MINGARLRALRLEKGLTQEELGNLLGVSKVAVCGYEKGNKTPGLRRIEFLTNYFNVSSDFLLGNDVNVVCETDAEYTIKLSKEDITIIKELKKNKDLYQKLCEDPKRTIALINKKM